MSEEEYDLSLVKAIGEAIEKYKEKGDDEAVERLSEELGKVMEKREAA